MHRRIDADAHVGEHRLVEHDPGKVEHRHDEHDVKHVREHVPAHDREVRHAERARRRHEVKRRDLHGLGAQEPRERRPARHPDDDG